MEPKIKLSNLILNISKFHDRFDNRWGDGINEIGVSSNLIRNQINQNIYDEPYLIILINQMLDNFMIIHEFLDYVPQEVLQIEDSIKNPETRAIVYNKLFSTLKEQYISLLKFDFTQEVINDKQNNPVGKRYYINGIQCCYVLKYREAFCSMKNGRPSNIRDTYKTAQKTSWDLGNIRKIIIKPKNNEILKDSYPDTNYGYTGRMISFKEFKECIQLYINS